MVSENKGAVGRKEQLLMLYSTMDKWLMLMCILEQQDGVVLNVTESKDKCLK